MTVDRADELLHLLGGILNELASCQAPPGRLSRIMHEIDLIEAELAVPGGVSE